jgi:phosphoglycerate kinase
MGGVTSVASLKGTLHGKRVLVRAGLNVPIQDGKVTDIYRLEQALQTIDFLRQEGARVILCGHVGRDPVATLEPVLRELQNKMPVVFARDIYAEDVKKTVDYISPGGVVLLENLRRWSGEKENAIEFAKRLASFADIYVNDAFPVCHRAHASIVGVPTLLPSYAGLHLREEIKALSKAFEPTHPFVFILGGAKVETKMPLIKSFMAKADTLFVGGVLANDFFKSAGKEIGKSTHSDETPKDIARVLARITLPEDVVVERNDAKKSIPLDEVKKTDAIYDAGDKSVASLCTAIKQASLVVWNGPLGYCEGGYCEGTNKVAEAIAESKAHSIVGGGDTLAAVDDDVQEKMSFISTGGGAMLELLAEETLVGIEALKKR